MFDISFSELAVIGIVALVVIGPERLPRVARTAGVLFGRLQRYVTQVKADINREMDLAEINRLKNEFEGAARSFQQDVETQAASAEREIREAQAQIDKELAGSATDSVMPGAQPQAAAASVEPPAASPQLELGIEETDPPQPARKPG